MLGCATYMYTPTHILYIAYFSHIAVNMYLHTHQCYLHIRQSTLHRVKSEQSHKDRLRQIRQIQSRQSHYGTIKYKKMASKQIDQNEFIVQAVAEATRCKHENAGIKMSGPILTQPTFNWRAGDKYEELQNFQVEASNMLQNYNLGQRERVSVIKN